MEIPEAILRDLRTRTPTVQQIITLRALSDLNNALGETYLFADRASFIVYAGKLKEELKETRLYRYTDILNATMRKSEPFIFVELMAPGETLKIKFAEYDFNKVNSFLKFWKKAADTPDNPPPPSIENSRTEMFLREPEKAPEPKFDVVTGFSAALHAMVHIDNEAAAAELEDLKLILKDPEILDAGLRYWKHFGSAAVIEHLTRVMTLPQKQCLLANMVEIAMIDGILKQEELDYLNYVCTSLQIDNATYEYIFNVLLMKNNMSVFAGT